MTLKEYVEHLNSLLESNPEAGEYEVITAVDPEGNGYNTVYNGPNIGIFDDGEFIPKDYIDECEREEKEINSVCLN